MDMKYFKGVEEFNGILKITNKGLNGNVDDHISMEPIKVLGVELTAVDNTDDSIVTTFLPYEDIDTVIEFLKRCKHEQTV